MAKRKQAAFDRLVVAKQQTLSEIRTVPIGLIRLTRVTYEGSDLTFIDVRLFSRGYDADGEELFRPTTHGVHLSESDFVKLVQPVLDAANRSGARRGHVH